MKLNQWLYKYGESHQNTTNKTIHWVCVPAIFFSIVGLLWSIPFPQTNETVLINWSVIALLLVCIYYVVLSPALAVGMFLFSLLCIFTCSMIETISPYPLWALSTTIFIIAWIGQFVGHKIEGKKPSFFEDIQFLLIGPAWLMHFIYKKIGVKY